MANKNASSDPSIDDKLLKQIENATASRPKGKFMSDGRYVIEVLHHGYQADRDGGESLVFDGRVVCTTADPDPLKATRVDDACHFRYVKNDSFAGNVKAICEALDVQARAVVYDKALVGKMVRLTATTITTRQGKPFTQITFEGFADGSEDFKPSTKPASARPAPEPADDEPPF